MSYSSISSISYSVGVCELQGVQFLAFRFRLFSTLVCIKKSYDAIGGLIHSCIVI